MKIQYETKALASNTQTGITKNNKQKIEEHYTLVNEDKLTKKTTISRE